MLYTPSIGVAYPWQSSDRSHKVRRKVIAVLLLMIASLVVVFLGLVTDITIRTQGTSLLTHLILTYAGLLLTLLSHMVAFMYIIGLRKLLLAQSAEPYDEEEDHVEEST
jgi:cytochrome c biogenesis protein CcdA